MNEMDAAKGPSKSGLRRLAGSTVLHALGLTMLAGAAIAACNATVAESGSEDAGTTPGPAVDAAPEAAADPCGDAGTIPDELPCTGLYVPGTQTLAAGVMPYTPGLVFYSDGADKSRWLRFPEGTTID